MTTPWLTPLQPGSWMSRFVGLLILVIQDSAAHDRDYTQKTSNAATDTAGTVVNVVCNQMALPVDPVHSLNIQSSSGKARILCSAAGYYHPIDFTTSTVCKAHQGHTQML